MRAMFIDEKIALLERQQRLLKKEEQKEEEKQEREVLTLEQAKQGIEEGILEFEKIKIEFEKKIYFEDRIQVPIIKSFYDAMEETEDHAIYVNHEHEISQIFTYLQENMQKTTLEQWQKLLVNGMVATGFYADIVKVKQLKHLEYLCYYVPSKKGDIYNMIFRMRGEKRKFTGNFNCTKEERDCYGIILEAMILKIDEWLCDSFHEEVR